MQHRIPTIRPTARTTSPRSGSSTISKPWITKPRFRAPFTRSSFKSRRAISRAAPESSSAPVQTRCSQMRTKILVFLAIIPAAWAQTFSLQNLVVPTAAGALFVNTTGPTPPDLLTKTWKAEWSIGKNPLTAVTFTVPPSLDPSATVVLQYDAAGLNGQDPKKLSWRVT